MGPRGRWLAKQRNPGLFYAYTLPRWLHAVNSVLSLQSAGPCSPHLQLFAGLVYGL